MSVCFHRLAAPGQLVLFAMGGTAYLALEIAWRGTTHWTMFLAAEGIQCAVFSNKADALCGGIIAHYFGTGRFAAVRGNRPGVPTKPDPTGLYALMTELGADPAATLFVGDSDVDILTGHNAQLPAMGALWGFRGRAELTAAGADARMNGCEMPVVICSGSGNQGITASVPVWRYGVQTGRDRETILRAVCLSDLITIHQKTGIGRLSAYCGAVSAGVGAGCGIAWLRGAGYEGICHTITNAAAMISGCICDGAKASCASKIAMGVETGILGYNMYLRGNSFQPGDGIVGRDVEQTIRNVGILASQGMKETDRVILKIMTE